MIRANPKGKVGFVRARGDLQRFIGDVENKDLFVRLQGDIHHGTEPFRFPYAVAAQRLADCPRLFDHLVGERKHIIRHRKIHCLRSFHIDDEQVARRDLDWQIGGLLALKNTGSQRCRAIEGLASVGAIGHQAAITGHEVLLPGCS